MTPNGNPRYSWRRAVTGLTRAARQAGIKLVGGATEPRISATPANVMVGGCHAKEHLLQDTGQAEGPAKPSAIPTNASRQPWPTTRRRTVPGVAPKALRAPTS